MSILPQDETLISYTNPSQKGPGSNVIDGWVVGFMAYQPL